MKGIFNSLRTSNKREVWLVDWTIDEHLRREDYLIEIYFPTKERRETINFFTLIELPIEEK